MQYTRDNINNIIFSDSSGAHYKVNLRDQHGDAITYTIISGEGAAEVLEDGGWRIRDFNYYINRGTWKFIRYADYGNPSVELFN